MLSLALVLWDPEHLALVTVVVAQGQCLSLSLVDYVFQLPVGQVLHCGGGVEEVLVEFLDEVVEDLLADHDEHLELHEEEAGGLLVLGLEFVEFFDLALEVDLVEELQVEGDNVRESALELHLVLEVHVQEHHEFVAFRKDVLKSLLIELHDVLGHVQETLFHDHPFLLAGFYDSELSNDGILVVQLDVDLGFFGVESIEPDELFHVLDAFIENYKYFVHYYRFFELVNNYYITFRSDECITAK